MIETLLASTALKMLRPVLVPVAVVAALTAASGGLYGWGHHEGVVGARGRFQAAQAAALAQQQAFDRQEAEKARQDDEEKMSALTADKAATQGKVDAYEAKLSKRPECALDGADVDGMRAVDDGPEHEHAKPAAPAKHHGKRR